MDLVYGGIEWGLRLLMWLTGAVMVVALLLVARDQVVLDQQGQPALALVTGVTAGFRGPGSLEVAFEFDGHTRAASVEQSFFGRTWSVGDRLEIEVDPSDLSRARIAGTNALLQIAAFALMVAAFVGVTYIVERAWKRRKQRRADRSIFPHEIGI